MHDEKKEAFGVGSILPDQNLSLSFVEISVSSSYFTENFTVSWCKHDFPSKRRELVLCQEVRGRDSM